MKTPKGTKDSSPENEKLKTLVLNECEKIFRNYNAEKMDTPTFELYSILMNKYENVDKEIFILENKKENGEKCALRYDLTVPFSRYIKMNNIKKMKRYQIGKVFRRDQPSKNRYREFTQCDYDCLGKNIELLSDIETLELLKNILDNLVKKFNLPEYIIKVNNRKILFQILELSFIPKELFQKVCSSIDKLDKYDWNFITNELVEKGLTENSIQKLKTFITNNNLDFLEDESEMNLILKSDLVVLDLSLARGLDYYTGIIFEVVLKNEKSLSIAGGGRYDELCNIPCIGFSLGIDRILPYLSYKNEQFLKAWIIQIGDNKELSLYKLEILTLLRKNDISVDAKMKISKSKKEFKFIAEKEIPYAIIIGENERKEKKISIKNIKTRKQETLSIEEAVSFLKNN